MSYYGADKVVRNYNMMGPVKAALESSVRYMAHELGERDIPRVCRVTRLIAHPRCLGYCPL